VLRPLPQVGLHLAQAPWPRLGLLQFELKGSGSSPAALGVAPIGQRLLVGLEKKTFYFSILFLCSESPNQSVIELGQD
jgi:hypothetical protein